MQKVSFAFFCYPASGCLRHAFGVFYVCIICFFYLFRSRCSRANLSRASVRLWRSLFYWCAAVVKSIGEFTVTPVGVPLHRAGLRQTPRKLLHRSAVVGLSVPFRCSALTSGSFLTDTKTKYGSSFNGFDSRQSLNC